MALFDLSSGPSRRACEVAVWETIAAYAKVRTIEEAAALGARFFRRDPALVWTTGNGTLHPGRLLRGCMEPGSSQFVADSSSDIQRLFPKLARIHELGMWTNDGQAGLDQRMPFWKRAPVPVRQRAYLGGAIRASRRAAFEKHCINRGLVPFSLTSVPITRVRTKPTEWETVTSGGGRGQMDYIAPLKSPDRKQRRHRWAQQFWLVKAPKWRATGKSIFTALLDDLADNGAYVEFYDPVWGRESFLHDVFIDALQATL